MTYEEYSSLKKEIEMHMDAYYNQDSPVISDFEYDTLMQRLKAAEKEHPEWVAPDSPSRKIGGTAKRSAGVKVTHRVPMLSIEDVFTREEVTDWVNKVLAVYPDAAFSVETKIDGLSMTLRYQGRNDNKLYLTLAETRGDGYIGEDVTANARVIPDVLQELNAPFDDIELRGEVYMSHEAFARFNEKQEIAGKKPAANPRNLAAGTLRQLDASVTRERSLRMFVFNIQSGPKELTTSHTEGLNRLEELGVPVVYHKQCYTADEVLTEIDRIGEMRGKLPYDIDGAVVKLDNIEYRSSFEAGSKYTSGHIAYKYPPEERIIIMDEIEVDVGRTGKLTFTGVFHDRETGKPARICGTNVSRATLHNQDYITEMKVGIGGAYKLFKSGEIIPRLNGCVTEPEQVFQAPGICPVCGGELYREQDTADIRCPNPSCPAQLSRTVSYFASLDCMNIIGLGETLIRVLVKEGYLKNYADIYSLKQYRDELIQKGLLGKEKNTDKILKAIEKSKSNEPFRLLAGLGIRNVGKATAKDIMKHYSGIPELMQASREELTKLEDVGETTAECIIDFFAQPENQSVIQQLLDSGVRMEAEQQKESSDALKGMTIVVTGTMISMSRKDITELIEQNGGKCTGSVSKKTDMLVAGENAGGKLQDAQKLGIRIITEGELLKMLASSVQDGEAGMIAESVADEKNPTENDDGQLRLY